MDCKPSCFAVADFYRILSRSNAEGPNRHLDWATSKVPFHFLRAPSPNQLPGLTFGTSRGERQGAWVGSVLR